jgi:hypothetical protein
MGPCPGDDRAFAITVVWQVRILGVDYRVQAASFGLTLI